MHKITYYKEAKLIERYCQVTKQYFKYFKSIYSSTVYLDKPLMRLPIANIDKILVSRSTKLKTNFTTLIHTQIYMKFTPGNNFL
jgi:hypothetical protein